jgi:hypothetical protein
MLTYHFKDKKEGKTRTATFLTCIGADALEIFDGFVFANEGEANDVVAIFPRKSNFCGKGRLVLIMRSIEFPASASPC